MDRPAGKYFPNLKLMANPTPTETPRTKTAETSETLTSPLRCLTGALIAGGLTFALYSLTASIAQTFAAKPIASNSTFAINIAVAVRTLVVGVSALGTGVFGLVAVGLVALAIQISIQRLTKPSTPPSE
ncbi:MAG TPA: DUF3082 domain-containing protein [Candidatus Obscuribacterales bacterium]